MQKSNVKGKQPNVVLILADDMGFSDLGCFGSEINTPNLDKLAANGVRLTQMYNTARCCPSRASLLTGLYPHQAGIGHMMDNLGQGAYQGYLNNDCITIAEALKLGGYSTGLSGKWHVGGHYGILNEEGWTPGDEGHPIPTQRGFDQFYGTLEGCGSFYNPHTLMEGDQFIKVGPDETSYYYTDAISDKVISMIDSFAQQENPFFLFVSYTAPHWPLHALPEDIAKYVGRYSEGWDVLRQERYERMVELGIIDRQWPISPRNPLSQPWDETENQEWEAMRMAVYAAQVDRMDQGIGKIIQKLEDDGKMDDTFFIFLSDNGGCAEFLEENGWIEDYVPPTRMGIPVVPGNDPKRMPGGEDTYMSYDLPWANASNTPFRLFKHWVHEGGIATPMIVHWPNGIDGGDRLINEPAHVKDIMATCLNAAGIKYPHSYNNREITPLEGESLLPLLKGEDWQRQHPICWEHEGNAAVRMGDWKLVRKYPGDWELYNMAEDRTELDNLASVFPERVEQMTNIYSEWAQKCNVEDWAVILGKLAATRA